MKQFVVTLLFLLFLISGYSQKLVTRSYSTINDIPNKFIIRVGFSTPAWKYYGFPDAQTLRSELNVESKIGANFEFGRVYIINKLKIAPGFRLGINVDYLSLKAQVFNLPGSENLYNIFFGSKVGPSFTYMPEKEISFNIYAKLNPIWVGSIYYNHQDFEAGLDAYLGYVQAMYSFGIDVRVGFILVGFEYELGGMRVKNSKGEYWGDYSDPEAKKTPMPGFNLTLGLSF